MGVPRGKIRPHEVTGAGQELIIWGDTAKLSEFFTGIAEAPITQNPDRIIDMPQMIVKRYPSDTGFTRKAHKRRVAGDTGIKRGTTPGKPFYIEEKVLDVASEKIEIRTTQFTYVGTTLALRSWARTKIKIECVLRWQSGRFEQLTTAPGPTTLGALGTDRLPA
jgi:hypothetical protein